MNRTVSVATARVVMIRHGHVEGIDPPRFRGQLDLELTPRGRRQAVATAGYVISLMRVAAIYTSPMERCIATGKILGAANGLDPIPVSALNDIDYGAWQGLTHEEVERCDPAAFRTWQTTPESAVIPGAETLTAVAERVCRALHVLQARHTGQTIALIGHDGTNRLMLMNALNLPFSSYRHLRQDPCGVSTLEKRGGEWIIRGINETAHLPMDLAPAWDVRP